MQSADSVIVELDKNGVTFKKEGVGLFDDEPMEIGSKDWEDGPIDDIRINKGAAKISADFDDNESGRPSRIQLVVESVDRQDGSTKIGTKKFWQNVEMATGINYDPEDDEIHFVDGKSDKENYVNFIQFLFDEEYLTKQDLPYQTPNARKHWLLNTQPVHKDGSSMERPGEPVDGVFTETYHSKDNKKKNMKLLVEEFIGGVQ